MIAFLLDDELERDDGSWTKAMVKGKAAPEMLAATIARARGLTEWTAAAIRAAVEAAAVTAGLVNDEGQPQLSKAQGPVRVATTGRSVGPPLFESLEALGRERTLGRLRAAAASSPPRPDGRRGRAGAGARLADAPPRVAGSGASCSRAARAAGRLRGRDVRAGVPGQQPRRRPPRPTPSSCWAPRSGTASPRPCSSSASTTPSSSTRRAWRR